MLCLLLMLCLLACTKKNAYQDNLDVYFKKEEGYKPVDFKFVDTTTMQQNREQQLERLKIPYRKNYDAIYSAYKKNLTEEWTDDFVKLVDLVTDDNIKALYDFKKIDSLESLLNGFDAKLPYRINGRYTFLNSTDSFKYFVVFNDSMKVIDAVRMR